MIRFLAQVTLSIGLAYLAQQVLGLPWWSIAVATGLSTLVIRTKGPIAFLAGFFGVFLYWMVSSYLIHQSTNGILTQRVANLFSLDGTPQLVLVIAAILGGLVGGWGGSVGAAIRHAVSKKKPRSDYYKG